MRSNERLAVMGDVPFADNVQEMACQVVHYPKHSEVVTELAPEPRDVVWSKISMSSREAQIRDVVVIGFMTVLLLTWISEFTLSLVGLCMTLALYSL